MTTSTVGRASLGVVIVNYNTAQLLERSVANLVSAGLTPSSIFVVDNASQDESRAWLTQQSPAGLGVLYSDRNLGFAAGNNLALGYLKSDYVLLLNTDAFADTASLDALIGYAEAHPEVGILGPQLVFQDGSWQRSSGALPSLPGMVAESLGLRSFERVVEGAIHPFFGKRRKPREVGYVDGASMLFRRSLLQEIGGLDERFFFYGEDVAFCWRAKMAGYKVMLLPQAHVIHLRGSSSSKRDVGKYVAMRNNSMRTLVELMLGELAWTEYIKWERWNYRMRFLAASLLSPFSKRFARRQRKYREVLAEMERARLE